MPCAILFRAGFLSSAPGAYPAIDKLCCLVEAVKGSRLTELEAQLLFAQAKKAPA
jgi:hypothetical protein